MMERADNPEEPSGRGGWVGGANSHTDTTTSTETAEQDKVHSGPENSSLAVRNSSDSVAAVEEPPENQVSARSHAGNGQLDTAPPASTASTTQESAHSNGSEPQPRPPKEKESDRELTGFEQNCRRLGWLVILILAGGTTGIIGLMSFWAFLWFGQNSNATWHWIMVHDHLKVIVSSTAEIVNRLVGFMLGTECAMIIALALERALVLFPNMASASAGRAGGGSGKTWGLAKKVATGKMPSYGWDRCLPFLVLLVTLIENLSLGTHTVLFTDINLGRLPTRSGPMNMSFGFSYEPETISYAGGVPDLLYRYSAWQRKSPFYPAFAEYSEEPVKLDGVSDTGLTLRAFLPYADPLVRQSVHSYTGRTTVLDSRVTCQVPKFENLTAQFQQNSLLLSGFVRATRQTPRLGNVTLLPTSESRAGVVGWSHNTSVPFICIAPLANTTTRGAPDQWRTALCQLTENGEDNEGISGGLVSEFKNYPSWLAASPTYTSSSDFGTAYIVFNVSSGVWSVWGEIFENQNDLPTTILDGQPMNEWLQFSLTAGLSFGATLCYSAFDTADIMVSISSSLKRNVTEPVPTFNFGTRRYEFDDLRRQYGQSLDANAEADGRGIFILNKQSWIASAGIQPPTEPYIRQYANLAGPQVSGNEPNWSGFLFDAMVPQDTFNLTGSPSPIDHFSSVDWLQPDPMHGWLFQDIVAHGGSVAFALQSLITLLASMAYYDQLAQFNNREMIQQSFFKETNLPTRYWGWLAVTIGLVIHLFVASIVLCWFMVGTKYTLLRQNWQTLAQAITPETADYVAIAVDKTDDEVKAVMKTKGGKELMESRVRLGPLGENGKVGIYVMNKAP